MLDRTSLAERVFETIDTRGVEPKPHWHFLLHEWVVWGIACSMFLVGSVATALSLYIVDASFFVERHIVQTDLGRIFGMLPWVWLVLVVVAVAYAVYALTSTEHGYRWHVGYLVLAALFLSVCTGYALNRFGMGEAIDRYLLTQVALYRPMSGFFPEYWMNVSEGRWVGMVVDEVDPNVFVLHSIDGTVWNVRVTDETVYRGLQDVREYMRVRVVGTSTEEGMCEAYEVHTFRGRGGGMRREHAQPVLMLTF